MAKYKSTVRVYKLTCNYVPLKGDGCQQAGVYQIKINASEYAISCELHCNILQQEATYLTDRH